MADLALNSDHDLDLSGDTISLSDGDYAIIQHIKIRLLFIFGEWFLDTRLGVTYLEEILGKPNDMARVDAIFREVIRLTPGVESIVSFDRSLDRLTRKLRIDFVARKIDGEILSYDYEFILGDGR